jgi:hypothetical protein
MTIRAAVSQTCQGARRDVAKPCQTVPSGCHGRIRSPDRAVGRVHEISERCPMACHYRGGEEVWENRAGGDARTPESTGARVQWRDKSALDQSTRWARQWSVSPRSAGLPLLMWRHLTRRRDAVLLCPFQATCCPSKRHGRRSRAIPALVRSFSRPLRASSEPSTKASYEGCKHLARQYG